MLDFGGRKHRFIAVRSDGKVEVDFKSINARPPFDSQARRDELLQRLNGILGIDLADDPLDRTANNRPVGGACAGGVATARSVLEWAFDQVRVLA